MRDKLKQKKFQKNRRAFILIAVLCMGIGFAFLSSNLTITGNTSVSGNKWNVYFTNVQVTDGSVEASVVPTTSGTTTTSIDYTVTLDKPGDFYEFTVDAVNDGTIDAMIESITTPNIDFRVLQYLSYTATYEDGTELAQNDVLEADDTTTYKVRVEFKKNISAEDLDSEDTNLTLTFGVNYVQSNIKPVVSQFAKLVKSSALSDIGLNFAAISSASNGRGLYVMNSTTGDDYPIYYYRGNVSNNNAKFAGFCWRIVRTTDTGGTKLIYNGIPNANGECINTTGDATQLGSTSGFNSKMTSPAYIGYMYGTVYEMTYVSDEDFIYGSTFTYENGMYTLVDTSEDADATHHYTCLSTDTSCESINYVYRMDNDLTVYYITLTDGKNVEDALVGMQVNTNDSTIKTVVDNWFHDVFSVYFTTKSKDYTDYLEDTVWCNDRSMNTLGLDDTKINNGWNPNGGSISTYLYYSAFGKRATGAPNLICSNKNNSFTVTESVKGNGKLTYPVGLLTVDEIILAGGANANNSDYYLNTQKNWWTMSPAIFYGYNACEFLLGSNGRLSDYTVNYGGGVRPSISLKPGVKIAEGGDGSSAKPYEFVVE